MDFQYSCLLATAASFVTGAALSWLALRGRIAAAAAQAGSDARSAAQVEVAKAQRRASSFDEDCQLANANVDKLNDQTAQLRDALDQAQAGQMQLREALDQAHAGQAQLAERAAHVETLEAKLLALQDQEKASQQELQTLSASDAESVEALKRVSARLAELEDEDAALKLELAAAYAPPAAETPIEAPAAPIEQATQLPALETEVVALQSLAKTIQEEFLALLEVQRNFTAASSALQDVS